MIQVRRDVYDPEDAINGLRVMEGPEEPMPSPRLRRGVLIGLGVEVLVAAIIVALYYGCT